MSPKYRGRAWRRELIWDAVFAVVFAIAIVMLANMLWRLL
jgi:hypothetical protein